jgi:hypothetical protein
MVDVFNLVKPLSALHEEPLRSRVLARLAAAGFQGAVPDQRSDGGNDRPESVETYKWPSSRDGHKSYGEFQALKGDRAS